MMNKSLGACSGSDVARASGRAEPCRAVPVRSEETRGVQRGPGFQCWLLENGEHDGLQGEKVWCRVTAS